MLFERYSDLPATTLPTEPSMFALRRAADELRHRRAELQIELMEAEAEQVLANEEKRYPRMRPAGCYRSRIHELTGIIDWLGYRADMKDVAGITSICEVP